MVLRLSLTQASGSGLSVREYTTEPAEDENENVPDFRQMKTCVLENGERKEYPVVPGTSWAGAFRHHMQKLSRLYRTDREAEVSEMFNRYFGIVKGTDKRKSQITFSETILQGTVSKILTRNAIGRFSGGAEERALYTEETVYGGNTVLTIRWNRRECQSDETFATLLAASVADLDAGILPIGGETSIGRGLFRVEEINGRSAGETPEQIFHNVKKALLGEEGHRNA